MISIIIPTYNRGRLIETSIYSILHQTYKDIEVIIVDDGSTDNTEEVVSNIKDPRIIFEKLKCNQGANFARNRGVELAKGEYIAFQDSDDYWLPLKLELQLKYLNTNNSDIIVCAMMHHGKRNFKVPKRHIKQGFISFETLILGSIASTQMIFGKRECFNDIKFDNAMPRLQDWDLMLRMIQKYKVYYLDEVLVKAYVQEDSISSDSRKGVNAIQLIYQKHKDYIDINKVAKAKFFEIEAGFITNEKKTAKKLLEYSMKTSFRFKTLIKYILLNLK